MSESMEKKFVMEVRKERIFLIKMSQPREYHQENISTKTMFLLYHML